MGMEEYFGFWILDWTEEVGRQRPYKCCWCQRCLGTFIEACCRSKIQNEIQNRQA